MAKGKSSEEALPPRWRRVLLVVRRLEAKLGVEAEEEDRA